MGPLLWLVLAGALGAGGLDFRLGGDGQLRAGFNQSPNLSREKTPLFQLILRPAATVVYRKRLYNFSLLYSPRMLQRFPIQRGQRWQLFSTLHTLQLQGKYGQAPTGILSSSANLSVGTIDLGQAEQGGGEFSDSIGIAATNASVGYLSALGTIGYEADLLARWQGSVVFNSSYLRNRSGQSSTLSLAQDGSTDGAVSILPVQPGVPGLKDQLRFDNTTRLFFKVNDFHRFGPVFTPMVVNFKNIGSYWSYLPGLRYEYSTDYSRLSLQGGLMRVRYQPFPGIFYKPGNWPLADFTWNQKFTKLGAPRLSSIVGLSIIPFYDIIFGSLYPRVSLSSSLSYRFTTAFSSSLAVQYFQASWLAKFYGIELLPGMNKQLLSGRAEASYNFTKDLALIGGVTVSDRVRKPSGTNRVTQALQVLWTIGVRGLLPVEGWDQ